MNRISNRNRYSQQSNARGIDTNKKFIPFFTQLPLKDKADYRIAYFIAHLREEVNRHKGINRPYKPTKHELKSYDLVSLPLLEEVLNELHQATAKEFKINIKKSYEIGYTGNIRFLSLPAAMSSGTKLHDEWVTFFCQLFEYLNSMKISSEGLKFIRTLKQNEPDLYEYRFAVAVVQTFLKDLSTITGEDILMMPDKWNTASSGTFITKNEMVIKLFSPGKIYNEKQIMTSSTGPVATATARKYYNIQKGGHSETQIALMGIAAKYFIELQDILLDFQNALEYEDADKKIQNTAANKVKVEAEIRVESRYNIFIQLINALVGMINVTGDASSQLLNLKPIFTADKTSINSDEVVARLQTIIQRLQDFMPTFTAYNDQMQKNTDEEAPGEREKYSSMIGAVKYLHLNIPNIVTRLNDAAAESPDLDDVAKAEAAEAAAEAVKAAAEAAAEAAKATAAAEKAKADAAKAAEEAKTAKTLEDANKAAKAAKEAAEAADAAEAAKKAAEKANAKAVETPGSGGGEGGGNGGSTKTLSSKVKSALDAAEKHRLDLETQKKALEGNTGSAPEEVKRVEEALKNATVAVTKLGIADGKLDSFLITLEGLSADIQNQIASDLQALKNQTNKTANPTVISGIISSIQTKIDKVTGRVSLPDRIVYADIQNDILEIGSFSVTDMYNKLIVCGEVKDYATDTITEFDTEDIEDFYQKRMDKLYTEADTELKALVAKADPLDPKDPSASIANIFKSHGLKVSDNKYKYERNKGQLIITDLTTGKTVDSYVPLKKDVDTCKSMGITFNTAEQCYTFLNECILGENPEKCKQYLYDKDFWIKTVDDFRHNSNFHTIYITLKKYEFKINTSGILNVIEDVDDWVKRQVPPSGSPASTTIPQELLALLKVAVEEINKHPAILNVGFKGSVKPDTKQSRYAGDLIIALKLQEKTRSKLPSKYLREGSLDETGIIISSDKITQAVNTRADKMETILRTELEEIKKELDLLKAPLKSGSERTKYFHHQRGGEPPDYDLHKYEHYNRLHTLKNHMKNIDTGMSSTLMESFTKYIYALEVKDIKLHSANQERIKNEIEKIRNLEIFLMRTAFYVYKFIFFFSEFKTYLPLIDPGSKMYAEYVGNVEIDLKRLVELVDSTHGKLDQYCKNTNDGAAKPGKVQALATICSQLEELVWPKVPERSRM